jgi:hypothetical protein
VLHGVLHRSDRLRHERLQRRDHRAHVLRLSHILRLDRKHQVLELEQERVAELLVLQPRFIGLLPRLEIGRLQVPPVEVLQLVALQLE